MGGSNDLLLMLDSFATVAHRTQGDTHLPKQINNQMKRYIGSGPEQRSFCPGGALGLAWWHGGKILLDPQIWKLSKKGKKDKKLLGF